MEIFTFYKGNLRGQEDDGLKVPEKEAEGPAGRLHISQMRDGEKQGCEGRNTWPQGPRQRAREKG